MRGGYADALPQWGTAQEMGRGQIQTEEGQGRAERLGLCGRAAHGGLRFGESERTLIYRMPPQGESQLPLTHFLRPVNVFLASAVYAMRKSMESLRPGFALPDAQASPETTPRRPWPVQVTG